MALLRAKAGERNASSQTYYGALSEFLDSFPERNEKRVMEDNIKIVAVSDATLFASHLFREAFNQPVPVTPVHYVAFAQLSLTTFEVAGYYHVDYRDEYALVGGLCVEPRYRSQGIGEKLSAFVFAAAGPRKAFFAYMGNTVSVRIALRIGYEATSRQHLFVRWVKPVSEEEKEWLIAEVAAIGPF
jgi:GNAT superfamily N-acetyltransferase